MVAAKRPVQELVDDVRARGGSVALEAGCGSASHLQLDGVERLVGIDISAAQLERNTGLNERVVGDLETYRFPAQSFDLILIWDVLEHLDRPLAALDNLLAATRPGGLLVVAVPNLRSLKGLIAKVTPHWFHAATVRRAYPYWPTDEEDIGPFPTRLRRSIAPGHLREYARQRGLRVRHLVVYESEFQRRTRRICRLEGPVWEHVRKAVHWVTGGRITASGSDVLLVLQVPDARAG
jgi:SAM-dependent methyltransferase